MPHPIFYDPQRRRWKRVRMALNVAGLVLTLVVAFFAVSVLRTEPLPSLQMPQERRAYRALKPSERRPYPRKPVTRRNAQVAPSQIALNSGEGVRAAFYVTWDAGSFASLREYAHQIDLLFPEWLHVLTRDGRLRAVSDDGKNLFDVLRDGKPVPFDERVMQFLKSEKFPMEVFPLVNNFDPIANDWVEGVGDMLRNPAARAAFRQQVGTFLASDNYRGLTIDFEGFPWATQPAYRALLSELAADLHARGMKLYVAVPARNEDFDFTAIAASADGVLLMNYDEHFPGGPPGAVAAQTWFAENVQRALGLMPRDKIICSIANYGYDWRAGRPGADAEGESISVQEAWLRAHESEAYIDFDSEALNPHFSYVDESNNTRHEVWFLDGVTALDQMRAAQALGINTFALWRLGSEDRSLWKIWDNPGDTTAPEQLRVAQPGHDVDHEGQGEVMRIEQRPVPGERRIDFEAASNLIVAEEFRSTPLPYQVAHYGAAEKQVALSFDDGPDPQWTPKVLDILKQEQAPASFFVIGQEAERYPGLLDRMFREGHELGNHTWSHPDISEIRRSIMQLELNLTERLFEAKLGVKPLYFRPPYSIDQDPDTDDQVRPLELVQDFGYTTVGAKLDPHDWQLESAAPSPCDPAATPATQPVTHRRTAAELTCAVLNNLPPCTADNQQRCGNIILLHDGGGDRTETLKALPMIIEGVRARGFKIVPVSALLRKTRAEVMPAISPNERWSAWVDSFGFWIFGAVLAAIVVVFFAGDALMSARLFLIGALATFDRLRKRTPAWKEASQRYRSAVAILIPAYNEEKVIEQTVHAALASDYPTLRVIVVDDGSKDRTFAIVQQHFAPEIAAGRVVALTKPNAGKAEALNYALQFVTEEVFIGIDADTVVAHNAVSRLVPHFVNPEVGAVAGNAKVGNRVNLWTRWQALEYVTSQNFERRALNALASVSVVPGALGAWRSTAVRAVGGYHTDTVAEDADLTMALLQAGYRVEYEDRALAFTEAPVTARGLMRQRFRWSFGILQSVWKHRAAFGRKGGLGFVALPNIVLFQILLPLVSPFIDIMFAGGVATYLVDRYFHPQTADASSFHRLLLFFLMFLVIDFITSVVAFALERREARTAESAAAPGIAWRGEDPLLLLDVWLQRFVYRQLFSVVLFRTLKRALKGEDFAWGKVERTAAVPYARGAVTRDSL